MARALLLRWLRLFDVTPRDDLERVLSAMATSSGADLKFERPFRGYAQYAVLTLPPGPADTVSGGSHCWRRDCSRSPGRSV